MYAECELLCTKVLCKYSLICTETNKVSQVSSKIIWMQFLTLLKLSWKRALHDSSLQRAHSGCVFEGGPCYELYYFVTQNILLLFYHNKKRNIRIQTITVKYIITRILHRVNPITVVLGHIIRSYYVGY